jgi:hypothetical protein
VYGGRGYCGLGTLFCGFLYFVFWKLAEVTGWGTAHCTVTNFSFFMAQQPLVGQDLLVIEASRSYSDTTHSVTLLWVSDQPVADTTHTLALLWVSDQPVADTTHSLALLWVSDQPVADTTHSVALLWASDQPVADTTHSVALLWASDQPVAGTTHSLALLWVSDQPVAEAYTWQHTTLTRIRHPCPWRDAKAQTQQGSGRRRPTHYTTRGRWDRH